MKIEKKKSINYTKRLLKSKFGKHKALILFTVGWTRFLRKNKLVLGLSKSLVLKNSFMVKYFGLSIYLSKWNTICFNAGINSKNKLYNKGVDLDNSVLNKRFINVKNYWDTGRYYVNRKSGSKTFITWESKLKPSSKVGARDLTYLNSYTFSVPHYNSILNSKKKLANVTLGDGLVTNFKQSIAINKAINYI